MTDDDIREIEARQSGEDIDALLAEVKRLRATVNRPARKFTDPGGLTGEQLAEAVRLVHDQRESAPQRDQADLQRGVLPLRNGDASGLAHAHAATFGRDETGRPRDRPRESAQPSSNVDDTKREETP